MINKKINYNLSLSSYFGLLFKALNKQENIKNIVQGDHGPYFF